MKDWIASLLPEYLQLWQEICQIETPSGNPAQMNRLVDLLERFAGAKGFSVARTVFEKAGDCLLVELPGDGSAPIGMMAHMDTVHPLGAFGPDPVHLEGNTIYGPGVADCKGGIVLGLLILDVIKSMDADHPPMRLLLTSDEEVSARYSGKTGVEYIKRSLSSCRAVFNLEPSILAGAVVGRKGIANVTLEITGKAAHAGVSPRDGISAVTEAAHKILAINGMSDPDATTFNCSMLCGGSSSNTIPERCSFTVDIRDFTLQAMEEGLEKVRAIGETSFVPGTSCTVTLNSMRPPMEPIAENYALLERLNRSADALGMEPLQPVLSGGGSDACYTVAIGIPTVDRCSIRASGTHTLRERAEIKSLGDRAALLIRTILNFEKE